MSLIENAEHRIQSISDNMTIKSDYSEELDKLNGIESDLSVMRFYGAPAWRVSDAKNEIKRIKNWISEELQS